ncbi:MAG: HAMP domain-containing histidine kinase [Bacteroidetes bacterium]|nr:HAMP domain-containing histidine kinase [Bacteroidota bacterium]
MKLLLRSTLYKALLAVPIALLGTAAGYTLVHKAVTHGVDEQLAYEAELVAQHLLAGQLPAASGPPDRFTDVRPGNAAKMFSDTLMPEPGDSTELIPWRKGTFPGRYADGAPATITVGRSMIEPEDLVAGVAASMVLLLLLVILGNLLLDRWLSRRLWSPFHATLAELERFRIDGGAAPEFNPTRTEEFSRLNSTLERMALRMRRDHSVQKRFTEQAAHELRTPLAVMRGKLDLLIQSPRMGEADAMLIDGLYKAADRMGRTVGNMLLLAQIGNRQHDPEDVDWAALFERECQGLQDPMHDMNIRYTLHREQACRIRLHPLLAELMVANLVRNAVQHNVHGGTIDVRFRRERFTVANTGPTLAADPMEMFERFAKGDPSSRSAGLGLSIVKEIADGAGLSVSYRLAGDMHVLEVMEG